MRGRASIGLAYAVLGLVLARGGTPDVVEAREAAVPVSHEPTHQVRFDNGTVRIYDVVLQKGQWSLFHEHAADNFYVFFSATTQLFEFSDGRKGANLVKAGDVGFSSTQAGPYTHRVGDGGDEPVHVADVEILSAAHARPARAAAARVAAPFNLALENARGRVYRIVLAAGESTPAFTRPAHTAIFAVTAGRISERTAGGAPRLWDPRPGDFRWTDRAEAVTLTNESDAPSTLVEVEVY